MMWATMICATCQSWWWTLQAGLGSRSCTTTGRAGVEELVVDKRESVCVCVFVNASDGAFAPVKSEKGGEEAPTKSKQTQQNRNFQAYLLNGKAGGQSLQNDVVSQLRKTLAPPRNSLGRLLPMNGPQKCKKIEDFGGLLCAPWAEMGGRQKLCFSLRIKPSRKLSISTVLG
ncbi:hypothetical protein ACLOJK_020131 [Asimina triloba]